MKFLLIIFLFQSAFLVSVSANESSLDDDTQIGDQIIKDRQLKMSKISDDKFHLDILVGYVSPTGELSSVVNGGLDLGGQFLYGVTSDLNLGAYYTYSTNSLKDFSFIDVHFHFYGIVLQYKILNNVFIQVKSGSSTLTANATFFGRSYNFQSSQHPFTSSAGIGGDFPLSSVVSFAPCLGYTYSFNKGEGSDEEILSYGVVEALAALRLNF